MNITTVVSCLVFNSFILFLKAKSPTWTSKEEPRNPLPELQMPEGPEEKQGQNTSTTGWPTPPELR